MNLKKCEHKSSKHEVFSNSLNNWSLFYIAYYSPHFCAKDLATSRTRQGVERLQYYAELRTVNISARTKTNPLQLSRPKGIDVQ